MRLILTVWQRKALGQPTRGGEGCLEDPSEELFAATVAHLLGSVDPSSRPFQIVAQVGDSSRGVQLRPDWSEGRVATELWAGYQGLAKVVG